ncbi:MAG: PhnD/SsuA/transferrin family substrate-binding protein [Bernardetiaceae bacterium]
MAVSPLRIGGVPEHFNYPWHWLPSQEIHWQDFPGGTGAMLEALHADDLDMAIVLTEGALRDVLMQPDNVLVGTYVSSPLTWGLHVQANAALTAEHDLSSKTFAISRYNSGSHLMAFVYAEQKGWTSQDLRFVVVGNFEGAKAALADGTADIFLWEKFTTQPTVDQGLWRRIDVCPTPWPCFLFVARRQVAEREQARILQLFSSLRAIHLNFPADQRRQYIAQRYGLSLGQVDAWFAETQWDIQPRLSRSSLQYVQDTLLRLDILTKPGELDATYPSFVECS